MALIVCVACGGGTPDVAPPPPVAAIDAGVVDAAPAVDAGRTATEAEARLLLAERFRAAGFRVRQDVRVGGATLDGADPQRRVGFEYVAAAEAGAETVAEVVGWRVLVVAATDAAGVAAAADAFLDGVGSDAGP
jgi:hypothetical protein